MIYEPFNCGKEHGRKYLKINDINGAAGQKASVPNNCFNVDETILLNRLQLVTIASLNTGCSFGVRYAFLKANTVAVRALNSRFEVSSPNSSGIRQRDHFQAIEPCLKSELQKLLLCGLPIVAHVRRT